MKIRHLGLFNEYISFAITTGPGLNVIEVTAEEMVIALWRVKQWKAVGSLLGTPFNVVCQQLLAPLPGIQPDTEGQMLAQTNWLHLGDAPDISVQAEFRPVAHRVDTNKWLLRCEAAGITNSGVTSTFTASSGFVGGFSLYYDFGEDGGFVLSPHRYWAYANPDGSDPVYSEVTGERL